MPDPNYSKMSSMHFYGWRNGLKTGQYYLRSKPAVNATKFTVNIEALLKASDEGNSDELIKCLNKDNEQAFKTSNDLRKKKRSEAPKDGQPNKKRKLN